MNNLMFCNTSLKYYIFLFFISLFPFLNINHTYLKPLFVTSITCVISGNSAVDSYVILKDYKGFVYFS